MTTIVLRDRIEYMRFMDERGYGIRDKVIKTSAWHAAWCPKTVLSTATSQCCCDPEVTLHVEE